MLWFDDLGVGGGRDLNCLLEQAVEQFSSGARRPAVETKRELVEVVFQVLRADGPLVGSENPPLEQRGDAMDARHGFHCRILGFSLHRIYSSAMSSDGKVAWRVV